MSAALQYVCDQVSEYMDSILKLFKPGAKITVLVRSPNVPGDADFMLANDVLDEVVSAIQRRKAAGRTSA